jgi:hypothetical protein
MRKAQLPQMPKPWHRTASLLAREDADQLRRRAAHTAMFCLAAAVGCAANDMKDVSATRPTYFNEISRIIRDRCESCHRSDGPGPFALDTYERVRGLSSLIDAAVRSRQMPPWLPDPNVGEWLNDRSLLESERDLILSWIRNGSPPGDSLDAPEPAAWTGGWSIGQPDAVLQLPAPVRVPAQGVLDYRYVYVRTNVDSAVWIRGIQIRPTAPRAVHHVLVVVEEPLANQSPSGTVHDNPHFSVGLDGFFAAYVPGHYGITYPFGYARLLPKGATLKFQLHYTPYGNAEDDQTQLGLVFHQGPPDFVVETAAAVNTDFTIPPEARHHEVSAMYRVNDSITLLGFLPHMHVRGKAFQYELLHRNASVQAMLQIPRFDFDWQEEYLLKYPISVDPGSWLRATGWFDNSRGNPRNPDPSKAVRFGEQTYDEMMNGYFHYGVRNRAPVLGAAPGQ